MEATDIIKRMVEDGCISQEVAEKYCPEIKKYKDEIVKKQILELIRQHSVNSDRCTMENWIYSHAQSQPFKPTDEQIKGIECAIKTLQHQLNVRDKRLNSLYNDLKKLKQ